MLLRVVFNCRDFKSHPRFAKLSRGSTAEFLASPCDAPQLHFELLDTASGEVVLRSSSLSSSSPLRYRFESCGTFVFRSEVYPRLHGAIHVTPDQAMEPPTPAVAPPPSPPAKPMAAAVSGPALPPAPQPEAACLTSALDHDATHPCADPIGSSGMHASHASHATTRTPPDSPLPHAAPHCSN
ncbi:hypothetical protein QJQ45_029773, partial [Haematococcus lacustris]